MPITFINCNHSQYKIKVAWARQVGGNIEVTVWRPNVLNPVGQKEFSQGQTVYDVYHWLETMIPNFGECVYPVELSEWLTQLTG